MVRVLELELQPTPSSAITKLKPAETRTHKADNSGAACDPWKLGLATKKCANGDHALAQKISSEPRKPPRTECIARIINGTDITGGASWIS